MRAQRTCGEPFQPYTANDGTPIPDAIASLVDEPLEVGRCYFDGNLTGACFVRLPDDRERRGLRRKNPCGENDAGDDDLDERVTGTTR